MIHIIAAAALANSKPKVKRSEEEELKSFAIDLLVILITAGVMFLFTYGLQWFDEFTMTHNTAFDPYTLIQPIKDFFK